MLAADFILVYVPGLLQLGLWLNSSGKGVGLGQLMTMGLTPFIAGDVVKVLAAAGAAWAISPKTPVAATKR
jgi:biotin transport system substrate-specific component